MSPVVDLIDRTRTGRPLTGQQIHTLVAGHLAGDVPDYQMSAWLMAVACQGLSTPETVALTEALAGRHRLRLATAVGRFVVDKHSTGGVGDTTTLALAPLLVAAGVPVAKMTGAGLGHAGGTVDKLAAIPGLRLPATRAEFLASLAGTGLALAGQTPDLAPGDGALYRLRDVTGTVAAVPLIAASIMSKKIAVGASALVLDVKTGPVAVLPDPHDTNRLARLMTDIGAGVGLPTTTVISDMSQPVGPAIGNALEVAAALTVLHGKHVPGLSDLVLTLATEAAAHAWPGRDPDTVRTDLLACLHNGQALSVLRNWVARHGGDPAVIDYPDRLPAAAQRLTVQADTDGWIAGIDAAALGRLARDLGAGRTRLDTPIDPAVGLRLHARVGDPVTAGQPLIELHLPTAPPAAPHTLANRACAAVTITDRPAPRPPLIHHILRPAATDHRTSRPPHSAGGVAPSETSSD